MRAALSRLAFECLLPDDDEMLRLRAHVYIACGFLAPEDCPQGLDQDEYDRTAVHFGCRSGSDDRLLGTARLVAPGSTGLPMERCFTGLPPVSEEPLALEFSRLAVLPCPERTAIMVGLIRMALDYSFRRQVNLWLAALDQRVWKRLQGLGFAVEPVGPPVHYMGSLTLPCRILLDAALGQLAARNRPVYGLLAHPHAITVRGHAD